MKKNRIRYLITVTLAIAVFLNSNYVSVYAARQDNIVQKVNEQDDTAQDTTEQDRALQDMAEQDDAVQDTSEQDMALQDMAEQDDTVQDTTEQDMALKDTAEQDDAVQDTTEQDRALQDTAEQDDTAQNTTGEDNIAQDNEAQTKEDKEFRAVWIAYYELVNNKAGSQQTEDEFSDFIGAMFDNAVNMNMNAVVVHVRPFSDAMYKSKYYPWSKYASGRQGVSPGYDPLKIMVDEAHERGLEFHAWLNPYRITSSGTDVSVLSKKNPARKWLTDDNPDNDRNVIRHGNRLFYNPSRKDVRSLIVNGIKEIVKNYDVDGIHFDDYFYPDSLGANYENVFDAEDYRLYVAKCKAKGSKYKTIANWRRNNVNKLIKSIYKEIKKIDETVVFGISPGGFLDYLIDDTQYYVDFPTWMASSKYIDYICPQLYWGFDKANKYPFDTALDRWLKYKKSDSVKFYVGIGTYKMNQSSQGKEWLDQNILKNMIKCARETKEVNGFILFDYTSCVKEANSKAMKKVIKLFKQ